VENIFYWCLKVLIGIPAFNEEKNIAKIIVNLQKLSNGIIVCDDGSSDATGLIAEKLGVTVIHHERNKGYGAALRSIFLKAQDLDADILVTFDADGQHQVNDISKILEPIEKKQADLVIGSRFLGKEKNNIPNYRGIGIKTITGLTNTTLDKKITDSQSGLRAYAKQVFNQINPSEFGMGASTEILIRASKMGLRIVEVPIYVLYKDSQFAPNALHQGISVAISTIKYISLEHPLKFYGFPGLIFLVVGLFFVVWALDEFSTRGTLVTNLTLIGVGTTILGVVLINTSIILYSLVNLVRER